MKTNTRTFTFASAAILVLGLSSIVAWGAAPSRRPREASQDDSRPNVGNKPPLKAVQLALGAFHSCALLDNGAVRCWGDAGDCGELGYGNTKRIGDDEPASAGGDVPLGRPAKSISAGSGHTCAVLDKGGLKCWGDGDGGALGRGKNRENIGDNETPASVPDISPIKELEQMVSCSASTCVIHSGGRLRCWGGQYPSNQIPSQIPDIPIPDGQVAEVACNADHSCLLLKSGHVRCWGAYDPHTGAVGTYGDDTPSVKGHYVELGALAKHIVVGAAHSCALLSGGRVRCWGSTGLGYGPEVSYRTVFETKTIGDVPVGGKVRQLTAGWVHTCALMETGAVRCWGGNDRGQLGYGHTLWIGGPGKDEEHPECATPAAAGDIQLGGKAVQVAAGGQHTCAIMETGKVRCWGGNDSGQLGYGHTRNIGDDETPASAGDVPLF